MIMNGNYYSLDSKYIKILDIGSILPQGFVIGIQSIYDYDNYNLTNLNVNNYSSVTTDTVNFQGEINNFGFSKTMIYLIIESNQSQITNINIYR